MSSCRDITSLLAAEPDGTLDAVALARIEAHVATCLSCRRQRAALAAAPVALRAASTAIRPPDAAREWAQVRARIQKPDSAARRSAGLFGWPAWTLPAAATAALALAAVVALRPNKPGSIPLAQAEEPPSTLVYVDQESGWLIVWADPPAERTG